MLRTNYKRVNLRKCIDYSSRTTIFDWRCFSIEIVFCKDTFELWTLRESQFKRFGSKDVVLFYAK